MDTDTLDEQGGGVDRHGLSEEQAMATTLTRRGRFAELELLR